VRCALGAGHAGRRSPRCGEAVAEHEVEAQRIAGLRLLARGQERLQVHLARGMLRDVRRDVAEAILPAARGAAHSDRDRVGVQACGCLDQGGARLASGHVCHDSDDLIVELPFAQQLGHRESERQQACPRIHEQPVGHAHTCVHPARYGDHMDHRELRPGRLLDRTAQGELAQGRAIIAYDLDQGGLHAG